MMIVIQQAFTIVSQHFVDCGPPNGLGMSRGAHFAEPTVLALAHAYEQATEWHKRKPPLS